MIAGARFMRRHAYRNDHLQSEGAPVLPNIVLFQGQDALNDSGLWETNGTGSGTFELAPAGTGAQGLSPSGITVLGARVLFEGVDLSGHSGLWITDGTAVGTTELSSISGASSAGIAPSDLTVFGNEALFSGINASGQTGLWTTDGTANGTFGARRHHRGGGGGNSADRPDGLQPPSAVHRHGHGRPSWPVGDQRHSRRNNGADWRRLGVVDRTRSERHDGLQQ